MKQTYYDGTKKYGSIIRLGEIEIQEPATKPYYRTFTIYKAINECWCIATMGKTGIPRLISIEDVFKTLAKSTITKNTVPKKEFDKLKKQALAETL